MVGDLRARGWAFLWALCRYRGRWGPHRGPCPAPCAQGLGEAFLPPWAPTQCPSPQSRGRGATLRLQLARRLSRAEGCPRRGRRLRLQPHPHLDRALLGGLGCPLPARPGVRGGVSARGSGSLSSSCWAGRGARPRWGEVVSLAVQGRGVPLSWGSTRFPLPLPAHLPICSGSLSGLPHTQMWGSGRFWNGTASLFCSVWGSPQLSLQPLVESFTSALVFSDF